MIGQGKSYVAVATKVRAMRGKMLTDEQWRQLMDAASLRAVWQILQGCAGWKAAADVHQGQVSLFALSDALTRQMHLDLRSLGHFLPREDRQDLERFMRCLERGMAPEEFQQWWSGIHKGDIVLRHMAGAEADVLNLVYILRLRRFPASVDKAGALLIPIREKLKPSLVKSLLHARTDEEAIALLEHTPWAKLFTSTAPGDLEKQYRAYMHAFCAHLMVSAHPGMGTVLAFVALKYEERDKLRRLMGAVEQGIDPRLVL